MIATRLPNRCAQALHDAYALVTDPAASLAASPSARHRAWLILKSSRGQTAAQRRRPAPCLGPAGGDAA